MSYEALCMCAYAVHMLCRLTAKRQLQVQRPVESLVRTSSLPSPGHRLILRGLRNEILKPLVVLHGHITQKADAWRPRIRFGVLRRARLPSGCSGSPRRTSRYLPGLVLAPRSSGPAHFQSLSHTPDRLQLFTSCHTNYSISSQKRNAYRL